MQADDSPTMTSENPGVALGLPADVPPPVRPARLAAVLRLVLEHLEAGVVVALTPAEVRLAHRLEGALAAFDVSSRVWSDPLPNHGDAG